jgi:hypothetical protein
MNTVVVNGKRYDIPGGNISVINNKVYCNGKLITDTNEITQKNIKIVIEGPLNGDVSSDNADITVYGNVNNVNGKNGNITITGDVHGNVENKNGNVKCNNVQGHIDNKNGNVANKSNFFQKIFIS